MKTILPRLFYWVLVAVVSVGVISGLWLTWSAQQANYRLGQGIEQVLRVVYQARLLRLSPVMDESTAFDNLIYALNKARQDKIVPLPREEQTSNIKQGLLNSWGDMTRVYLYPQYSALRVESEMDSQACRRMASFFVQDAQALKVQRVDVRLSKETNLWQLVFDQQKGQPARSLQKTLRATCGRNELRAVSITFALNG